MSKRVYNLLDGRSSPPRFSSDDLHNAASVLPRADFKATSSTLVLCRVMENLLYLLFIA